MVTTEDLIEVSFAGESIQVARGETLLDTLQRQGAAIPSSCRAGICQSCLMRAVEGTPPRAAQKGLKPALQSQGYFLACLCRPEEPFAFALGDEAVPACKASVLAIMPLGPDVVLLRLAPRERIDFKGGQFLNLHRPDGLVRSYSIASLPTDGAHVDFHVRRLPDGRMSGWVHEDLRVGDQVELRGPHGDCSYVPGAPDEPLLFAGTGTGMAPLYAVLRDALQHGHQGPIHVLHGGRERKRLYIVDEFAALAERHPNVHYVHVLLEQEDEGGPWSRKGALDEVVMAEIDRYRSARAYLCGDAGIVHVLRRKLFLAGVSLKKIHSDAFVPSP